MSGKLEEGAWHRELNRRALAAAWRTGGHVGANLYAMTGGEDRLADQDIGRMSSAALAAAVAQARNIIIAGRDAAVGTAGNDPGRDALLSGPMAPDVLAVAAVAIARVRDLARGASTRNGDVIEGGEHWQWEDPEQDNVLDVAGWTDESSSFTGSLRSAEQRQTSAGPLPHFAIYEAEEVEVPVGRFIEAFDPAWVTGQAEMMAGITSLHRAVPVHGLAFGKNGEPRCEHDPDAGDPDAHYLADDGKWYCQLLVEGWCCQACRDGDGTPEDFPCATLGLVLQALGIRDMRRPVARHEHRG